MQRRGSGEEMEPHGQARGVQQTHLTTPMGPEIIWCANTKASSGHPPGSIVVVNPVRNSSGALFLTR